MKIGITLNEVLRDYLGQIHHVYDKYLGPVDFEPEDIKSFDLLENYKFNDKLELNKFLYTNCSLEIFGHADQTEFNIFNTLNNFITDINDETEHEVYIISREVNTSIPATLFFLSKVICKCENIKFVQNYEEKWEHVDVLITANPITLSTKPKDKISIKIKHPYNESVDSDYEFDKASDALDVDVIQKIIEKND